MGIIFKLSSVPGSSLPPMPSDAVDVLAHKSVHFVEYSVLGFLLLRVLRYSYPTTQIAKLMFISAALLFLFGASDEWHQSFVPGRYALVWDVIMDTGYGVLGMFLFHKIIEKGKGR